MKKNFLKVIKAAIISLIVAFLFVLLISCIVIKVGKEKFEMATNLLQIITISENDMNLKQSGEGYMRGFEGK